MSWISARFSERSTQVALSQLLTIWSGVGTAALLGTGPAPFNVVMAAAVGASVPCVISIFLPEAAAAPSVVAPPAPAPIIVPIPTDPPPANAAAAVGPCAS